MPKKFILRLISFSVTVRILSATIVFLISSEASLAQSFDENRIIPPSPLASSFARYGDFENSGYSGQPIIDIPIYTIKNGDLEVPLALSYNLSSVKPNEVPGWVGLGWNLGAGGVISRTVRGLPDDLNGQYGSYGYYYDFSTVNNQISQGAITLGYSYGILKNTVDTEPDVFHFNFNGHTGSFIIGNDGLIKLTSKEKLKVVLDEGGGQGWGFTIITPDGTTYEFGEGERGQYSIYEPEWNLLTYTSSWYLTDITSRSDNHVSFTYTGFDINNIRGTDTPFRTLNVCNSMGFTEAPQLVKYYVTYLNEIRFAGGKMAFERVARNDNYGAGPGQSDWVLSAIHLYDLNDVLIRSWELTYDPDSQRPILISIGETAGGAEIPPYRFSYNPMSLPVGYTSGSIDYWGYYNGSFGTIYELPVEVTGPVSGSTSRASHEDFAKAGTLEKIIFPTGGYSVFDYELHEFSSLGGGTKPDVNFTTQSFKYEGQCPINDISCYEASFDFDETTSITLSHDSYVELQIVCRDCDATVGGSYANQADRWWITLPPGTYLVNSLFEDPISDIISSPDYNIDTRMVDFIYRAYKIVPLLTRGGGLRLKSVSSFERDGAEPVIKEYEYELNGNSTGILSAYPEYSKTVEFGGGSCEIISTRLVNKQPAGPLVTYSMVREVLPDGGSIERSYTTHSDHGDEEGTGIGAEPFLDPYFAFIPASEVNAARIDNSNMRGLLTLVKVYDSSGSLIKSTSSNYEESLKEYFQSIHSEIYNVRAPDQSNTFTIGIGSLVPIKSSLVRKVQDIVTTYSNGQQLTDTAKYFYDNPEHFQMTRIEKVDSKGTRVNSYFRYPEDYSQQDSGPVVNLLKSQFVHDALQYKYETVRIGQVDYLTSAEIIQYGNNLFPELVASLDIQQPLDINQAPVYLPVNGVDNLIFRTVTELEYDTHGNVVLISRPGGETSFKWKYGSSQYGGYFPVCRVTNAQPSEVYHESFEESGNIGTAVTGEKYYWGSSFTIPTQEQPSGTNLVMTYWYYDGTWKFKSEIPYNSTISEGGATRYDEVRVYPAGAEMTTYTYDPTIGMTSMTDANNRTTYYEYDDFGRLRCIKDDEGNILKTYTYHNKGEL